MRLLLVALAIASLPALSQAGEIRIPADQPDLEAALAVAVANDVILVQTTADQGVPSGSLRVTQPVAIIGDPVCNIAVGYFAGGISLEGPGFGEVTLMNVELQSASFSYLWSSPLRGGGFDSLSLYGFQAADNFVPATDSGPSGLELSGIPSLTIVDSYLWGQGSGTDAFCVGVTPYPWVPGNGIFAPESTVLIIDSIVRGGYGGNSGVEYIEGACPPDLSIYGGQGGNGIVAKNVYAWNSSIRPGVGVVFRSWDESCGSGTFTECGKQADGRAVIVSGTYQNNRCSRLTQTSSTVALGGDLVLNWDPLTAECAPAFTGCGANCLGFLFVSLAKPVAPYSLLGGLSFLAPQTFVLLSTFDSSLPVEWAWAIPATPALSNTPITAQVALRNGELSGPAHLRLGH